MNALALLAWCAAFAGPLMSQQTWKVHCNGSYGAHFTDLPPAVAAAAPGDTILVYHVGTTCSSGYTAVTIDKPLRIVGFQAATTPLPGNGPTVAKVVGLVTIAGIPGGQYVSISNLGIAWPPGGAPHGLEVINCAGDVLIEDVYHSTVGDPYSRIRIANCANVVLRGCDFDVCGTPLEVIDSNVLITNTIVQHSVAFIFPPPPTSETLRIQNSAVTTVGSIVRGAFQISGNATRAVVVHSGALHVGPHSYIAGGYVPPSGWNPGFYTEAYTILNPALGTVYQDARATFNYAPPAQPPIPETIHATYHSWVVANDSFGVTVVGPSGGFALLGLGPMSPAIPTPFGPLTIDPLTLQTLDLVYLSSSGGDHSWTFFCPGSAPNGYAFTLQSAMLDPSGAITLSVPSPLTVGWESGRTP